MKKEKKKIGDLNYSQKASAVCTSVSTNCECVHYEILYILLAELIWSRDN
jgi:hypothetical protein